MRRIFTFLMAAMILAFGAQAKADLLTNWTLDLSTLGGATTQHINSLSADGVLHLVQNVTGGVPTVGDTFTLTNSAPPATPILVRTVGYTDNTNNQNVYITPGKLFFEADVPLTGEITQVLGGNIYKFAYDNPGATHFFLDYQSAGLVDTHIASFDLLVPPSGGQSTDGIVGSTGLLTGTSDLSATMTVLLPGVLFNSLGQDLFGTPNLVGALQGGFIYNATLSGNQIIADSNFNDNSFTISSPSVPEPTTILLLGCGVLGLAFMRRRSS